MSHAEDESRSGSGTGIPDDVRAELQELAGELDAAATWTEAVAAFGEYLAEEPDSDPWSEIATTIERCLADERPASFIRLGDGEGNMLALRLGERPALAAHCARAASRLHFGTAHAVNEATPEVLPALHRAIGHAEVVGFPGPFGSLILLERPDAETYARPVQGLISVHRYLCRFAADLSLDAKTGAPAGFHRGLLPHYERLISGRAIGIITCHAGLAEGLRARMGAVDVDLRPVPPQAAAIEGPRSDTGHWPGRFHELCRELETTEPGRLWLVAAGMLGKVYCDVIRAAGGIAVDIGHTADVWAGLRTRANIKPSALATWRLT